MHIPNGFRKVSIKPKDNITTLNTVIIHHFSSAIYSLCAYVMTWTSIFIEILPISVLMFKISFWTLPPVPLGVTMWISFPNTAHTFTPFAGHFLLSFLQSAFSERWEQFVPNEKTMRYIWSIPSQTTPLKSWDEKKPPNSFKHKCGKLVGIFV